MAGSKKDKKQPSFSQRKKAYEARILKRLKDLKNEIEYTNDEKIIKTALRNMGGIIQRAKMNNVGNHLLKEYEDFFLMKHIIPEKIEKRRSVDYYPIEKTMKKPTKPMQKAVKQVEYQFYVLNIKITSNELVTAETYRELFENAFKNKKMGKISTDHYGIIRQLFTDKETNYLYGIFCKFVKVENKAMDINSLEIVNFEIAQNLFPNPREASFVLFPDLHRIGILKNSKITLSIIQKMLIDIFNPKNDDNFAVEVNIEQTSDAFKKILTAKEIRNIHIEVSPSNADISKDVIAFIDKDLKKSGVGKIKADIQPNASGKLKTEGVKVLSGLFGLAQSNGNVKATIINEDEKKEVINTESHPRLFKITSSSVESARPLLYNTLLKRYRNGKKSS